MVKDGLGLVDIATSSTPGDFRVAEWKIGASFDVGRGGLFSQLGK